jgi:SET and MYND domain-containing protein 5
MHYPPETASILLILRIFAMIKTQPELLDVFAEFCDKTTNEFSICHKLLGERFTAQLSELHEAVANFFNNDEVLGKYLTTDGLTRLFALVGTNSQGIGTSSFAEWVKNVTELDSLDEKQKAEVDALIDTLYGALENTVGQFLNNEGAGLYLQQSKINHSCNPNAEIRFPFANNTLQVVATREIAAEEEITISYLDECQLNRSRHSRQKYLEENYLFSCECDKCQEEVEQPDETSEEEEEMETDDDD